MKKIKIYIDEGDLRLPSSNLNISISFDNVKTKDTNDACEQRKTDGNPINSPKSHGFFEKIKVMVLLFIKYFSYLYSLIKLYMLIF